MMKTDKIRILMAALAMLSVASCQKEGVRTLTATFEQFENGSKAYIDDDYYACWEDDDAVAVNGTPCAVTLTTGGSHANSAEITIPGTLDGVDLLAFYPADKISDMSAAGGIVDFPHIQTYRENSDGRQIIDNPMAAYCPSDGEVLKFRNLGSLLKVTIPNNDDIKAIQVKGTGNQMLCGKAQLKFDNDGDPMLSSCTDGSSSVTLRFPTPVRANGKSFYIVLPPNANFETLTIAVLANNGTAWATHAKTADMGRVLARNHIAAFSYNLSHHEDYDFVADWTIRYTATERLVPNVYADGWGIFEAEESAYNFSGSKGLIVFDDIITKVGQFAYWNNNSLQVINLPESVTEIESRAFEGVRNLTSVSMPCVTTIGSYAFNGCSILTTISLPNATTIGDYVFSSCSSLTTISLPNATTIGDYAFSGCAGLTTFSLPNATTIGNYAFKGCSSLTSVSLDNVTTIGNDAFNDCSRLTTISFPNATMIGEYAFYKCSSLTMVSLPNATSIGKGAFNGCSSLSGVSLPEAATIGDFAFRGCSSLTSVSLPEAITIGEYAFISAPLTTISLPNATTIGESAFDACSSLTSVSLPKAITIGAYAFRSTPLATISLSCATTIGESAFCDCSSLTVVTIPKVTSIEYGAFYDCTNLTLVYSNTAAPTMGSIAFYDVPATAVLHLPRSLEGSASVSWSGWPGSIAYDYGN